MLESIQYLHLLDVLSKVQIPHSCPGKVSWFSNGIVHLTAFVRFVGKIAIKRTAHVQAEIVTESPIADAQLLS